MPHKTRNGFTLVEMLVVAPIVIIVVATVVGALIYLTGDALRESGRVKLVNDIQHALNEIETDVKMSGGFLAVNNSAIVSPQGYNDSTGSFTNILNGGTLVLNTFVTDRNPLTAGKRLVYLAGQPYACGSANEYRNQIMTMNTVYFVKSNTLWKRTLATSNYETKDCSGVTPWQRPSCTPGRTGTQCKSQDESLITVNGTLTLSIDYFTSPTSTTPRTTANTITSNSARQAILNTTDTVLVTITANTSAAGRGIEQRGSIRVTRPGPAVTYATPTP